MRVAVAGGTGVIGRKLVTALGAAGHDPVILARSTGIDLTVTGLEDRLVGVEAVIDATNVTTARRAVAVRFFTTVTENLLDAEVKAGVRHHVCLSITGIDRVDYGYYQGKLRQEELVRNGPVPWTILRVSPLHEFADNVLGRVPGPIAMVPRLRIRPIAAREVADALVALVAKGPAGQAPDLGGPRDEDLVDMARRVVRARRRHRLVLSLRAPGAAGRAMAEGAQLPTGSGPRGVQTFADWLAEETRA